MYFKDKTINGKKYRYALKSIRLPNGRIVSLEIMDKGQSKQELGRALEEKEKQVHIRYALEKFRADHIINETELKKIEEIKFNYRKLLKKLTRAQLKDLFDRFTANFTYESNALEGNSLTLKDVAIVMFESMAIKNKDLREIYETRNSRDVVELLIKNQFSISEKDILKMHKLLTKDIDIHAGYKVVPNFLLGRDVKTTSPEQVPAEMGKIIEWYGQQKEKLHPLKLASQFHGRFEQIHPFEDGNGRVGRFLINAILIDSKYPPLIVRKSQRIAYLKALENFDKDHQDTLERFLLERYKETYSKFFEIYIKYV